MKSLSFLVAALRMHAFRFTAQLLIVKSVIMGKSLFPWLSVSKSNIPNIDFTTTFYKPEFLDKERLG